MSTVVGCGTCKIGFMISNVGGVEKCIPITAEYENCEIGRTTTCQRCKTGYVANDSSKKCTLVESKNIVGNCDHYYNNFGTV